MSGMTFFFLFVCIVALLFLIINLLLAPHNPYQEKYSIFECGFHSFLGQNRTQFGVKFFIFALVYLLLDLEILLTFPFALSEYINDIYGLSIALIFIIIITIGFVFELGKSALKIDSRQVAALFNVKSSNVTELIGDYSLDKDLDTSKESSLISQKNSSDSEEIKKVTFFDLFPFDSYNNKICGTLHFFLRNVLKQINKEIDLRKSSNFTRGSVAIKYIEEEFNFFIRDLHEMLTGSLDLVLDDIDSALLNNISLSLLINLDLEKMELKDVESLRDNIKINLDEIEHVILRDAF
jgi:NADH-ubiquinone oxidoreductase chain 3